MLFCLIDLIILGTEAPDEYYNLSTGTLEKINILEDSSKESF